MSTASSLPSVVDILLQEYDNRFKEIMSHSERYNKQTDVLNLVITSVIAAAAFASSDKGQSLIASVRHVKLIYGGFLIFVACLVLYLFSSIINSLFMIYLNGARVASIEKEVNKVIGQDVLVWDSVAIPRFLTLMRRGKHLWINPSVLAGGWILIIFLFICAVFCCLSWTLGSRAFALVYTSVLAILALYHICQWGLLITFGKKDMYDYFNQPAGELPAAGGPNRVMRSEYLAAALPVLSSLITIVASIQMGAFGFGSRYDFPLLAIPSVFIGDLFFLPFLNYRIMRWLKRFQDVPKIFYGLRSVLAAMVALPVNGYIHYMWFHDPWTGFMDDAYAHMTLAGWVHLVFSGFELWFVLLFLAYWGFPPAGSSNEQSTAGKQPWFVFILFSTLGIADLVIKHLYIVKSSEFSWLLVREAMVTLSPLAVSVFIYRYFGRPRVSKQAGPNPPALC